MGSRNIDRELSPVFEPVFTYGRVTAVVKVRISKTGSMVKSRTSVWMRTFISKIADPHPMHELATLRERRGVSQTRVMNW